MVLNLYRALPPLKVPLPAYSPRDHWVRARPRTTTTFLHRGIKKIFCRHLMPPLRWPHPPLGGIPSPCWEPWHSTILIYANNRAGFHGSVNFSTEEAWLLSSYGPKYNLSKI